MRGKDSETDGLRELETLLERDLRGDRPVLKGGGVTRKQVRRALVRLAISALLLLLAYFLGVFGNSVTLLLAGIVLVAVLEGVLLISGGRGDGDPGPGG